MKSVVYYFLLVLVLVSCKKEQHNQPSAPVHYPNEFELLPVTNQSSIYLSNFSFFDDKNGIVCGDYGFFAKTTDGGITWQTCNVGINHGLSSAFMLNKNSFYTGRFNLHTSTNAGADFTALAPDFFINTQRINMIHFNSPSKGLISRNSCIYRTSDGGNTWEEKYTSAVSYNIDKLQFTSPLIAYGCGGNENNAYSAGEIVKTTDMGETWTQILSTINVTSISFLSNDIGFYANGESEIFRTKDGGVSWTKISSLQFPVSDILFLTSRVGYLVSSTVAGIYQTTDGGATWNNVYTGSGASLNKLIKTPNHIYAIGDGGNIVKSK